MARIFSKIISKADRLAFRNFKKKSIKFNLSESIVSFTFDDVPESAIENGARILNKFGKKGTFYLSFGFLGKEFYSENYFDPEQLKSLIRDRHELACHTYNHFDNGKPNAEQLLIEIEKNKQSLSTHFPQYKFQNFSYPGGNVSYSSKKIIADRFCSSRTTHHGINRGIMDLHNLFAIKLYEDLYSLEKIYLMVDEILDHKGWLIFYTHDVKPDYSKFGCSPMYFEKVLSYIVEKRIEIFSVKESCALLLGQK